MQSEHYSHDSRAFIHSEKFIAILEKQFQSCACKNVLPTTVIALRQLKLLCEQWKMNQANLNWHVHTDRIIFLIKAAFEYYEELLVCCYIQ